MREFREMRKSLGDDSDAAAPYLGVARTLLGVMKNQMRIGGLLQSQRTVTLPNGVSITVGSRFGQDSVRIVSPPGIAMNVNTETPPGVTPPAQQPQESSITYPWSPSYVCVGGAYNYTLGLSGIYWVSENDAPIDVGASFGNSDIGQYLTSVSADGHVAVGWEGNNGVVYTRNGGLLDIPVPGVSNDPNGSGNSTAASISYDGGSVGIAAVPVGGAYSIGYVWHRSSGIFQPLSQVSVPTQIASETVVMSGNGKTAAGRGADGAIEAAVIVDVTTGATIQLIDGAKIFAMDYAGTTFGGCTNYGEANQTAVLWTPQGVITLGQGQVEGISADGTVACGTFGSAWTSNGFIWSKSKGVMGLGALTAAHCVSPCGTAIGGANASAPVVWDIHGNPTVMALPAGAYIYTPDQGGVFGLAQRAPLTWLGQGDTTATINF
ncbi:hypothetical protein [Burkholderia sp. JKS000303]|uniref:hypothetical protein n=1 Tax=Burkholderia sp. JKS000303 TaxID=1938747 RepID=UPI000C01D432|nr:hypothetical protein [Burkholderia sp. JKS000303]PFH12842.1 hypothetical protein BX604_7262 [Burkholderia sp. JKS000303]